MVDVMDADAAVWGPPYMLVLRWSVRIDPSHFLATGRHTHKNLFVSTSFDSA